MKKAWVLSYPLSAQRRVWSDWADAQTGPSLRWAHSHFVGFIMSRLIYTFNTITLKAPKAENICWIYTSPKSQRNSVLEIAFDKSSCFQNLNTHLGKRHTEYWFRLLVSRLPRNTPFYRGRMSVYYKMNWTFPVSTCKMYLCTLRKTAIAAIVLDLFWKFKRTRLLMLYLLLIWFWSCCSLITSNNVNAKPLLWLRRKFSLKLLNFQMMRRVLKLVYTDSKIY